MHKGTTPKALCVLKCWAVMPSSAKGVCKKEKTNKLIFFPFTVDKLQFEPPLRKETEAHSEMVIVISNLICARNQVLLSLSVCNQSILNGCSKRKGISANFKMQVSKISIFVHVWLSTGCE